jgi:hypothetical protein
VWTVVLHPARARLWSADRAAGTVTAEPPERQKYALLGVRPCDLAAIGILDRVLAGGRHVDPIYSSCRDGNLVIAVECTEPGATCFCTSMDTGPGTESGFDLAMTELVDGEVAGRSRSRGIRPSRRRATAGATSEPRWR